MATEAGAETHPTVDGVGVVGESVYEDGETSGAVGEIVSSY